MNEKLIYDVGFHKGEDTEFYLSKGYKVVAVEANPILADNGRKKFKKEIEKGKLILLNVGIADIHGTFPFYINLSQSEWSSFDSVSATRNNSKYKIIDIQTILFSELLKKYGTPYYLKIDIEGYDIYCVKSITELPPYISVEMGSIEILEVLYEKGYRKFKLINQGNGFSQINNDHERKKWYPYFITIRNGLNKWIGKIIGIKYRFASSGPFGEETKGKWQEYAIVKSQYLTFLNQEKPLNNISWFDIHAKY